MAILTDEKQVRAKIVIVAAVILFLFILIINIVFGQESFGPPDVSDENAPQGITFPIVELGSCTSKDECKTYCNDPSHMPECIKFAEEHGLMGKAEAERARKFSRTLSSGGPGSCRTPEECRSFCSNISNIDACIKWAEQNNLKHDNFEEAKKIQSFIKRGGQMPGGCTSRDSCEAYCGDFNHAEECFAFAERVGIAPEPGIGTGPGDEFGGGAPTQEQFRRLSELVKSGGTPGGCRSKEQCETYCSDQNHLEECIAFGEKVGFIPPEQAEKIRKIGGKGPGGCSSPQACKTYCDDSAHQQECFKFAEENGLIRPEELKHAKEGFVRLRAGLEQAPPEVAECLKTTLGQNIIEDIQSGNLTPGPQIGERVRACFERFGQRHNPQEIFRDAPPQVLSCLKEKFGSEFDKIRSGQAELTPELGDTFRVCFEQARFGGGDHGPGGGPNPQAIQGFLRTAPPGVAACLREKLGGEYEKISAGEAPLSPEIGQTIRSCFEQFRPDDMHLDGHPEGGFPAGGAPGPGAEGLRGFLENAPPNVAECLKQSVGAEIFSRIQSGERPSGEIGEKIRVCFGQNAPSGTFTRPFVGPAGGASPPPPPPPSGSRFPEAVNLCLKQRLSEDQVRALQSGSEPSSDVETAIRECFSQAQSPSGTLPPLSPIFEHPPEEQFAPPPSGTVEDPAARCSGAGGTWTGSTCEFPTQPPPPSSFQNTVQSLLGTVLGPFINFFVR